MRSDIGSTKSGRLDMSKEDAKLARLQRKMSRAKKGGSNRAKLRKKVARQYARIRDMRQYFLHKESLKIVRSHDRVAVEDLAINEDVFLLWIRSRLACAEHPHMGMSYV